MKTLLAILSILTHLLAFNFTIAQTTVISDTVFEQRLINLGYDSGPLDGSIPTSNIDTIKVLDISFDSIVDLTGIEDFISLEKLYCNNNRITNLDFSSNTSLSYLNCSVNELTSLIVTQNTLLQKLLCYNNLLNTLDVTQNINLVHFSCYNNLITSLDITQNSNLNYLDCNRNDLISIDVTQNINLDSLICHNNDITMLDLSQNSNLILLICDHNQLTELDVSLNLLLRRIDCRYNLLTCVNVKNGNNLFFWNPYFQFNPNLTCIEVDNSTYSTNNWSNHDPQTSFSTNCNNTCSTVDINELQSPNINIFPNPTTRDISIDLGETKTNLSATLTNSLGQLILIQKFESTDIINISIDAPSGVYILKLETTNGETINIKVLKE